MRKFHIVRKECRKHPEIDIILPKRSTKNSAGYDFTYQGPDRVIQPNEKILYWSDICVELNDNEVLIMDVRSSIGIKSSLMFANTIPIIDADYIKGDNNGNIGLCLINYGSEPVEIKNNTRIAQGIILNYLITDDDNVSTERTGGLGSTGK